MVDKDDNMVDNAHSVVVDKEDVMVDKRKTVKIHSNTLDRLRALVDKEDTDNGRIEFLMAHYSKHKEPTGT